MRKKKLVFLYLILTTTLVSFACGLNLGLEDVDIPFVPTKTATPTLTPIPTVTPTYPPKYEMTTELFLLQEQEDNTTLFTDIELGYQLEFSPEWLVIPIDEETQTQILEFSSEELTENMQQMLVAAFQQAGIRVIAMDFTLLYQESEDSVANINVVYLKDPTVQEYELSLILQNNAETVPTLIPDANVTYQAVQTNSRGVEYAKMVVYHPASTFGVPLRQIMMMVKLEEGILMVTGSVEDSMYATVEPVFQQLFNSLEWVD